MNTKEKLQVWLEKNPSGYLDKSYREIAEEVGISASSVGRSLKRLIADRDNILPSEVQKLRDAHGKKQTPLRISEEEIGKIREYHDQDVPVSDICYRLNLHETTVRKYIKLIASGALDDGAS